MKQVFVILILLLTAQPFFAQTAANKLDRKGDKHGLWKDTTCKEDRVLCVEQGYYEHGQRTGTWRTTIMWDPDLYSKNSIITTQYSSGKKNGWGTTYRWSSRTGKDTVLVMRNFYRDDSLIEANDYRTARDPETERVGVIPDYSLYLKADSVFLIRYYSDFLEDSARIDTRTCWVSFDHIGGVSRSEYQRPARTKCTIIDRYYETGQLKEHRDSLLWMNQYTLVEYFENGQIKREQHQSGAIIRMKYPEEERGLFTYYKNDVLYPTRRPDTLTPRTYSSREFDEKGKLLRTSYFVSKDSAQGSGIDSVFKPAGVLSEYTTQIIYPDLTRLEAKYFPSGKVSQRVHTLNGDTFSMDTSFYESGAVKVVWIRGRSSQNITHVEYAENGLMTFYSESNNQFNRVMRFYKPGQRSETIWIRDTLRSDTAFYESGKIKILREGLNQKNMKRVTFYENGKTKTIETWTNGVCRKEEFDENGTLIKQK